MREGCPQTSRRSSACGASNLTSSQSGTAAAMPSGRSLPCSKGHNCRLLLCHFALVTRLMTVVMTATSDSEQLKNPINGECCLSASSQSCVCEGNHDMLPCSCSCHCSENAGLKEQHLSGVKLTISSLRHFDCLCLSRELKACDVCDACK